MRTKICGITREEDALLAASLGAWALGFVFWKSSPRYIAPEAARAIIARLPKEVTAVGVFVNPAESELKGAIGSSGIAIAQLHGNESAEYCERCPIPWIKAYRPKSGGDLDALGRYPGASAHLVDSGSSGAWGGSGTLSDWNLAREAKAFGHVILSGGLGPSNVAEAIRAVGPYAVDVSSGVESAPGRKDHGRLRDFFAAVASAARKERE